MRPIYNMGWAIPPTVATHEPTPFDPRHKGASDLTARFWSIDFWSSVLDRSMFSPSIIRCLRSAALSSLRWILLWPNQLICFGYFLLCQFTLSTSAVQWQAPLFGISAKIPHMLGFFLNEQMLGFLVSYYFGFRILKDRLRHQALEHPVNWSLDQASVIFYNRESRHV